jgi:hypothetical protein
MTRLYKTKYICVFLFDNLCFGDSKEIRSRWRKEKCNKKRKIRDSVSFFYDKEMTVR